MKPKKMIVKVAENLEISAYLIKAFHTDDGCDYHRILYCQNKIIEYIVYPIYKDWLKDWPEYQQEEILLRYKEDPNDILIEENDEKLRYAHIRTLVDYCIIPELD